MKNKFRKGEVVVVDGIGKISEKKHKQLGIIEAKDYYYNEYLITLISDKTEDWFREKDIKIIMERNFKKQEKFKVVLAIEIRGLEIIERKVKNMPNKNNNIFNKIDIYKEYQAYGKHYAILVWTSTYWSENNFVVNCIQNSFKELRKQNIAYKEIIIGETNPDYMKVFEFIDNDPNVDIFEICQKIKIKNVGGILV